MRRFRHLIATKRLPLEVFLASPTERKPHGRDRTQWTRGYSSHLAWNVSGSPGGSGGCCWGEGLHETAFLACCHHNLISDVHRIINITTRREKNNHFLCYLYQTPFDAALVSVHGEENKTWVKLKAAGAWWSIIGENFEEETLPFKRHFPPVCRPRLGWQRLVLNGSIQTKERRTESGSVPVYNDHLQTDIFHPCSQ